MWRDRRCSVQEFGRRCRESASWFVSQGGYDTYAYCCDRHFERVVRHQDVAFHRVRPEDDNTELQGPVSFILN